jgi:hypothetical protein
MAPPSGDPGLLLTFATQLDAAAKGTASLSASTGQAMTSIREKAQWSGNAATSAMALSKDLGAGEAAMAPPLQRIATAVRGYAAALSDAQVKVATYNLWSLDEAMPDGGGPAYTADLKAASSAATTALNAWSAAGEEAAKVIADAASELADVFPPGGPVQSFLETLPAQALPDIVLPVTIGTGSSGILVTTLAGDLGTQPADAPPTADLGQPTAVNLPGLGPTALVTLPGANLGQLINASMEGKDEGEEEEPQDGTPADDDEDDPFGVGTVQPFPDAAPSAGTGEAPGVETPTLQEVNEVLDGAQPFGPDSNVTYVGEYQGEPRTFVVHGPADADGSSVVVVVQPPQGDQPRTVYAFYSGPQT